MAEQPQGDKTEEPTPHKLREAKKKGQVVKSKEVTSAFLFLASFFTLKNIAQSAWEKIVNLSHYMFNRLADFAQVKEIPLAEVLLQALLTFFMVILPLLAVVFFLAIFVEAVQTGGNVSSESISPKLEKLNPLEGFKKIFSLKGIVMLIINLVKIMIVVWLTGKILIDRYPLVVATINNNPWQTMTFTADTVFTIAMRISAFYFFVAAFDYFYQYTEFMKQMKMTKQEVKEEYKRLEGDPLIKRRQRQAQQEMSQSRSMGNVPKSDVVVTNPVHLAVAIKYKPKEMKAPILLAKGKRLNAEHIKRIAQENNIPVVENASLAQTIFKQVKIGQEIPYELYKAVAEVLAFVYNLKKKKRK